MTNTVKISININNKPVTSQIPLEVARRVPYLEHILECADSISSLGVIPIDYDIPNAIVMVKYLATLDENRGLTIHPDGSMDRKIMPKTPRECMG